jgi:N-acetylglucosaminyl-diphospho-decaprenol L-rhamnosyltransferase
VDVIVVSYNSAEELRSCVEPLSADPRTRVIVVDNASADGGVETVRDLPVDVLELDRNGGFAVGVNAGWRAGSGDFVLLLNPDARITTDGIDRLADVMRADSHVGAVAPRIVDSDGALDHSLRRFPRLLSTFAQALFLHRIFAAADWTDEVVRDEDVYARPGPADWASGACLLLRRSALAVDGALDESFFMYCEDTDVCKRLWETGYRVVYEPSVTVVHVGGASAPRPSLYPTLAASRIRYGRKHYGRIRAALERCGVSLGALTHALVGRGGAPARRGHRRALAAALRPQRRG